MYSLQKQPLGGMPKPGDRVLIDYGEPDKMSVAIVVAINHTTAYGSLKSEAVASRLSRVAKFRINRCGLHEGLGGVQNGRHLLDAIDAMSSKQVRPLPATSLAVLPPP